MTTQPSQYESSSANSLTLDSVLSAANAKKDHDELVRYVKDAYEKSKNARRKFELTWSINLAFVSGRQNIVPQIVSGAGYKFVTPQAPNWRARPVINKIRPTVRKELSKLIAQKPSATVIPASSEDADLLASQAGEQIWESFYQNKDVSDVLRRALWWTIVTGTGYTKDWYDDKAVDIGGVQGDILLKPEDPFKVFIPDLLEESIEDQPWLIHASVKTCDWVSLHYQVGLDGREVKPNAKSAASLLDNAFMNLVNSSEATADSVLVLEMWLKPGANKKFPQGGLLTVIGDQLVMGSDGWPYQHQQYPFTKFSHIPTGTYYAESTITDLIPIQKEYNRTHGQIIEAKNRMAKPQLSAPAGSIDPNKITTEPGQVILYKPGYAPPQPIPLTPLPSYVLQELDTLMVDFADIAGQHEVSKGTVPSGVTAATAISYLQEQDDTMLSVTIAGVERGCEKIGRHLLSHVVQFWTEEHMIKITGADGSFDSKMLKNSDLRSNTDIRIEAGSALPVSRAAKQAFILDLMKMGFIDPKKGLEVMEIGGIQKIYENIQVDIRQAQRENLRMQAVTQEMLLQQFQKNTIPGPDGQPLMDNIGNPLGPDGEPIQIPPIVPVNEFDNHQMHIETHNRFRKSQAFEILPDHIKSIFSEHVKLHLLALGVVPQTEQDPGAPQMPLDPQMPTEINQTASETTNSQEPTNGPPGN
jgi:hypothetical protein